MRASAAAHVLAAFVALAVVAAAPAARDAQPLPRTGVAVETSVGVELAGLDGRVHRTLRGWRLRPLTVERAGQVRLRAPGRRDYELRAGVLRRVAAGTMTLHGGHTLRFRRTWTLRRGARVVERFPTRTHVELDGSGSVLTSFRVSPAGEIVTAPVALDLRTGTRRTLRSGCRIGAASGRVTFELCGYPYLKDEPSTIVRVDADGRRRVAAPARTSTTGRPSGWWRSVDLEPDAGRLLAQWSGECEIPSAHLVDVSSGRVTELAGGVEATTLGWAGRSALVALPHAACGSGAERAGVYAVDARGRLRLIRPLTSRGARAAAWR